MGRPKADVTLVRLNLRVPPEPAAWLERAAAQAGVSPSEKARAVLSRGRACEEGRCEAGALERAKNSRLANRISSLEEELAAATAPPVWAPPPTGPEGWDPPTTPTPDPLHLLAPSDPRAHLPVAWRTLDDKGLRARGVCPEHLGELEACAHEHDYSA